MTNSNIVSRVINGLKALGKDDRTSRRWILSIAKQKAEFYISQKLNDRSLYREDNLYTVIECFEMEKIEIIKCDIIEFRTCKNIMKSKNKIPGMVYSRYGNSLKEVTSIDDERDFIATTPRQYRKDKDRQGSDDYIRFYVKDGYLYLLDTEVEVVNLYLLTLDTEKVDDICGCSQENCKSLWEYEFICPSKISKVVIEETIQEAFASKQVTPDTNPNLDANQKGKTTA